MGTKLYLVLNFINCNQDMYCPKRLFLEYWIDLTIYEILLGNYTER